MLPYPILFVSLVVLWLFLNGFTWGHLLLGAVVGLFTSWAMASLRPAKPQLPGWYLLPKLMLRVCCDVVVSNIAVAALILKGRKRPRTSGFMTIPLELKDPTALAVLAVVLTCTPGTAWLEYDSAEQTLLMHVLDLDDEGRWRDMVKIRYEKLLMEIFE
jgi:multicomponent K+:H+ antiporter subunit E